MRTSYAQFEMMVEFMEKNGDLSKPSGGVRGRQWCSKKWKKLADLLNSEGSGKSQSEEKWHKVWSDFKNNTKRKWAKMQRSASATGGGPSLKIMLTVEQWVLAMMGTQAATGMAIPEAGLQLQQDDTSTEPPSTQVILEEEVIITVITEPVGSYPDDDWNTPGRSIDPTPAPPPVGDIISPNESPVTVQPTPTTRSFDENRRKRPKKTSQPSSSTAKHFIEAEKNARELERDRDRMMYNIELERIRQRDTELQLQAQWLEFMKECFSLIQEYVIKKINSKKYIIFIVLNIKIQ